MLFFQDPSFRFASIITSDAYSKFIDYSDRSVAPIFGDGASLTFMSNDNIKSIKSFHNGSDMKESYHLATQTNLNNNLRMNGSNIYMFVKKIYQNLSITVSMKLI